MINENLAWIIVQLIIASLAVILLISHCIKKRSFKSKLYDFSEACINKSSSYKNQIEPNDQINQRLLSQ